MRDALIQSVALHAQAVPQLALRWARTPQRPRGASPPIIKGRLKGKALEDLRGGGLAGPLSPPRKSSPPSSRAAWTPWHRTRWPPSRAPWAVVAGRWAACRPVWPRPGPDGPRWPARPHDDARRPQLRWRPHHERQREEEHPRLMAEHAEARGHRASPPRSRGPASSPRRTDGEAPAGPRRPAQRGVRGAGRLPGAQSGGPHGRLPGCPAGRGSPSAPAAV